MCVANITPTSFKPFCLIRPCACQNQRSRVVYGKHIASRLLCSVQDVGVLVADPRCWQFPASDVALQNWPWNALFLQLRKSCEVITISNAIALSRHHRQYIEYMKWLRKAIVWRNNRIGFDRKETTKREPIRQCGEAKWEIASQEFPVDFVLFARLRPGGHNAFSYPLYSDGRRSLCSGESFKHFSASVRR